MITKRYLASILTLSLLIPVGVVVSVNSASANTPTPTPSASSSPSSSPMPKISAAEKARYAEQWRAARDVARKDLDKVVLAAAKIREAQILKAKKVKNEEKRLGLISKAYKDYLVKAKDAREIYYQRLEEAKLIYQAMVNG